MIRRFSIVFVENIFFLLVLWGLLHMLGYYTYEGGMVKVVALIVLFFIRNLKWKTIDIIVVFYIFYCLLTYVWGDVRSDIYIDGIITQLIPISFYFIARIPDFRDIHLFEKMSMPLLFSFIAGIYLFFFPPSWYMDYRMRNWTDDIASNHFYEFTRLSGFWEWPYFIGTAALLFLMYEIHTQNLRKYSYYFYVTSIIIGVITIFLAQLRVSIAYLFIFLFFYLWDRRKCISTKKIIKWTIVFVIIGGFILYLLFTSYLDEGFVDYVLERTINKEDNIVLERVEMFDKFTPTISLLGTGLGGFSHYAFSVGKHSIGDCDYLRIANEIGIFGIVLLFFIIYSVFSAGLKNKKKNFFELNVHFYLLFAMIGSAPLEHFILHPYMYWYCMGRIVTNSSLK